MKAIQFIADSRRDIQSITTHYSFAIYSLHPLNVQRFSSDNDILQVEITNC